MGERECREGSTVYFEQAYSIEIGSMGSIYQFSNVTKPLGNV